MRRPLFLPTARQTNWLLIVAFLSVGEALYIRYMAIENFNVELACQAGLQDLAVQHVPAVDRAFQSRGVRRRRLGRRASQPAPAVDRADVALALAAAGFGIVLHNADLSALAAGLLILSLARPAPAPE